MSRSIDDLAPEVRAKAQALVWETKAELGRDLVIVSTLRTFEEQAALYAKGRTRPGPKVTNARPGYSWHNPLSAEGLARAFDAAFRAPRGGVTWRGPWAKVGTLGEAMGLEWGGRWPRFPDRPHFQCTGGMTLAEARAKYLPAGWA